MLHGFAEVATAAGVRAVRLDARHCEPSPAGLLSGLRQALGQPEDGSPIEALGFTAFAAQLPAGLHEVIQQGEPLSDPIRFTFPVSVRNRYERLCTRRQGRFPDGLLVLGE